jgi:hypothetical protein
MLMCVFIVLVCVQKVISSKLEPDFNAKLAEVYLLSCVLLFDLCLTLLIPSKPVCVLDAKVSLRNKELNKRMVQQFECSPPLCWVFLETKQI